MACHSMLLLTALQFLDLLSGARGLSWRLASGFVWAWPVLVAPLVGAVPLCLFLVPWWLRLRCDACVVSFFDACTAPYFGGLCSQLVQ